MQGHAAAAGGPKRSGKHGGKRGGGSGAQRRPDAAGAGGAAGGERPKKRHRPRPAAAAAPAPVDEAAELAEIWRQLGEDLGLPASASDGARQRALLRYVGCEWSPGGELTARPRGLRPSPLCLDALPAAVAAQVLAALPPEDRYACAAVSRGWRAVVRAPAAWAHLALTPGSYDDLGDPLHSALSALARFLYGNEGAQLPGVRSVDATERLSDIGVAWAAALARCPNLEELRCGLPPLPAFPRDEEQPQEDELQGCERGPSVGELRALATQRPALRCPEAHCVLRPRFRECGPEEDPIADLDALLSMHPRIQIASLTVSLDLHDFHMPEQVAALAAALAKPGGAALRAVDFGACIPDDATAGTLAAALRDCCPALRFVRISGWHWPDEVVEAGGDVEGDLEALRAIEPGFADLLGLHRLPVSPARPHGVYVALEEEEDELQQMEDEEEDDGFYSDSLSDDGDEEDVDEEEDGEDFGDFDGDDSDGDIFGDEEDEADAWE